MARAVERSVVKMVAMKRIVTGSMSLVAGVVLVMLAYQHGSGPTPMLGVALLLFWGGGAWTLRDGLRLRRELSAVRSQPRT
jgi:hypothetical protein